jgi:predicted small secreted protein
VKFVSILVATLLLSACGTVGGLVSGAGDDLKKAGTWIKDKSK